MKLMTGKAGANEDRKVIYCPGRNVVHRWKAVDRAIGEKLTCVAPEAEKNGAMEELVCLYCPKSASSQVIEVDYGAIKAGKCPIALPNNISGVLH